MKEAGALSAWLALALAGPVAGETVYRSVDADGRVTFSSSPPAEAVTSEPVELLPPLSEERQQQALARQKMLLELADEQAQAAEQRRAARELAKEEARLAEDQARAQLRDAKTIRLGDWIGGYGSGTLSPEYFERVRAAEQAVQAAERKQRRTGSGQLQ